MVGEPGRGGTSTPSMVGAVQRWRKQNEGEAGSLWREVAEANREVEESLAKLSNLASESRARYEEVLERCAHETAAQVGTSTLYPLPSHCKPFLTQLSPTEEAGP